MDVGVTASKILNGSIEVTCPDESLNCLVLLLSTTDNPDQVHVGLINSDDGRTVVLSPGATDVSVVVYTWKRGGSIFSGQLSFRYQLEPLTSKCEFTKIDPIFGGQCCLVNICCNTLFHCFPFDLLVVA